RPLRVLCAGVRDGHRRQHSQFTLGRNPGRAAAPASHARDGLISQTAPNTPNATKAVPSAAHDAEAASAVVAAQAIDEKASAKVARRDDVCLRRNWLRRACTRKQSWIAVAAAAAQRMPSAQTTPANTESSVSTTTIGANTNAIIPMTASILAQRMRREPTGAVATRSGASSPEIESHASPPARWPAAIPTPGMRRTNESL